MAGIREVFEIVDRATAPLRNVQAAMGGVVNQTVILNITLNENVHKQTELVDKMKKTDTAAKSLAGTIGKLVAAFGGLRLIKGAIDLSDELTLTRTRLNNINDGLQTTAELQDMIYQSAQRSRGSYTGMMQTVANLKAQTGETFSSVREAVAFTELLQKQFKIAGADAAAVSSTMYNLTQALSTGVLRGQDLNIVMSNAPQIAQRIAKAMGVSLGQLKEMASQGQVTSDVVKRAMFESADDINRQFKELPMTFSDATSRLQNMGVRAFQPLGQLISEGINSPEVEGAIDSVGGGLYYLMAIVGQLASFSAAGFGIMANALGFVTSGIGGASGAFIALAGIAVGAFHVILYLISTVGNVFIEFAETIANNWALSMYDAKTKAISFASGAVRAFAGVVSGAESAAHAIGQAFVAGVNIAIGGINKLIDAINKIPGVNIGGIAELASGGSVDHGLSDSINAVADTLDAMTVDAPEFIHLDRIPSADNITDAWATGKFLGEYWAKGVVNGAEVQTDTGDMTDLMNQIAQNTANAVPNGSGGNVGKVGKVGKVENVKLSDEDRKIYRDLAERRYMNQIELKTLAPEITVNLPAGASGNFTADDVADKIKKILIEQMAAQTSVAHA